MLDCQAMILFLIATTQIPHSDVFRSHLIDNLFDRDRHSRDVLHLFSQKK